MNFLITLLLSFLILLLAILAMAIGSIYGRRSIRGSCGGVSGRACELCSSERQDGGATVAPAKSEVTSTDTKEFLWR